MCRKASDHDQYSKDHWRPQKWSALAIFRVICELFLRITKERWAPGELTEFSISGQQSRLNRGFAAMSAWPGLLISTVKTFNAFHWWGPYWPHHHQWNPRWKVAVPKCAWLCRKFTWNQSSKFPSQHLRRYILEMHHSAIQAVHLATGKKTKQAANTAVLKTHVVLRVEASKLMCNNI